MESHRLDPPPAVKRGDWIATFELGSTVVLITSSSHEATPLVSPNEKVHYGQPVLGFASAALLSDRESEAGDVSQTATQNGTGDPGRHRARRRFRQRRRGRLCRLCEPEFAERGRRRRRAGIRRLSKGRSFAFDGRVLRATPDDRERTRPGGEPDRVHRLASDRARTPWLDDLLAVARRWQTRFVGIVSTLPGPPRRS